MTQPLAPLRVLHIEDSEVDTELVSLALRRAGYAVQVQRVETASAMAAALRDAAWDVVLADYSLPHFDALRALEVLGQSGQDIPFIIVSGTIDEVQAVTSLRAGAQDFITKGNLARLGPAVARERREAAVRAEHRQAQAQLRAQEGSFRLLFESNPLPMWVYEAGTLAFLEVNHSALAQYGYSRDEFLSMTIADIRPAEDVPALLATVQTPRADFHPAEKHWRHRLKDGRLIEVEITSHALVFKGRAAVLVVAHDITARRRAEAQLHLQGSALAAAANAIVITDVGGHIVWINPAFTRLTGYSAEEAIGGTPRLLNSGQQPPEFYASLWNTILAGQTWKGELINRKKDGSLYTEEMTITPVRGRGGDITHFIGIKQDVTDRQRAELALRQAEARYRTLVEQIPAITYAAAVETGQTYYISPQVETLGYTPADYYGDPDRWLKIIHPDDRERVAAAFSALRSSGQAFRVEYRVVDRAGHERWVQEEAAVVRDEAGQPLMLQGIVLDITERKRADAQIRRQLERLAALRSIDLAITGSLDLHLTLDLFLEHVLSQLGVHAADVLLLEAHNRSLVYAAGRGFQTSAFEQARVRLGEGRAGRAALERRIIAEVDPAPGRRAAGRTGLLGPERFASYYGVPLMAKGQVLGVLELFHRAPLQPAQEWLEFLEALAGQAAIAIENATLFSGLQRLNQDLMRAYNATIEGWSRALDLRDKETEGHSQRVTEYTLRLARAMGLGDDELVHVRRGALLHDIGKMGVPDNILLKPGPLTDDEWVIMRQHPVFAHALLAPIDFLRPAMDIPYCHHEKWDGTGYPRGLRGEQIPLPARLFAVVDVWDALLSERPYRAAWPAERVLDHLRALAGTHFDPRVVEAFLLVVGKED